MDLGFPSAKVGVELLCSKFFALQKERDVANKKEVYVTKNQRVAVFATPLHHHFLQRLQHKKSLKKSCF